MHDIYIQPESAKERYLQGGSVLKILESSSLIDMCYGEEPKANFGLETSFPQHLARNKSKELIDMDKVDRTFTRTRPYKETRRDVLLSYGYISNIPPHLKVRTVIFLLQGRFTLIDLMIGDDKKAKADLRNVFVADMVGIVVFYRAPPRVNSIIPRKRRIFAVHPSFPTKRRRVRDE
ncbi:hypothetical protein PQX77_015465 [Marasmius sp. AFHP31]|nr:hypothetical protein PQX77_015465 [Marasmius sp. AFHP31]